MKHPFMAFLAVLTISLLTPSCDRSEKPYPSKNIQMIIPWSPGGGSDSFGRVMAKYLSNHLDVSVGIINKPGVSGTIGLKEFSETRADGYTMALIHDGLVVSHHGGITDINYDDFEFIASLAEATNLFVVHAGTGIESVSDLRHFAQENGLKIGGTNKGAFHPTAIGIAQALGIPLQYISYEGTAERTQAVVAGYVDAIIGSYAATKQYEENGDINYVMQLSKTERYDGIPLGVDEGIDIQGSLRYSFAFPKGINPEKVAFMASLFEELSNDPDLIEEMLNIGIFVEFMSAQDTVDHYSRFNKQVEAIADQL